MYVIKEKKNSYFLNNRSTAYLYELENEICTYRKSLKINRYIHTKFYLVYSDVYLIPNERYYKV